MKHAEASRRQRFGHGAESYECRPLEIGLTAIELMSTQYRSLSLRMGVASRVET